MITFSDPDADKIYVYAKQIVSSARASEGYMIAQPPSMILITRIEAFNHSRKCLQVKIREN